MTAKEYLRQYIRASYEINARMENIEQIMALATKVTATLDGDRVQSGKSDKVGNAAITLALMRDDAEKRVTGLRQTMADIEGTIDAINDDRYRLVLYQRYILNKKWEQIAVDVAYDYRYVLELHGRALQKVKVDNGDY